MWRATSSTAWPSLEKARATARPMPELAPVTTTSGPAMSVLLQEPAEAGDVIGDAGESQRMPQRRLGRGDDRRVELLLQCSDHRMRTRVEAGHDQRIGAPVESVAAEFEQRLRLGFSQ